MNQALLRSFVTKWATRIRVPTLGNNWTNGSCLYSSTSPLVFHVQLCLLPQLFNGGRVCMYLRSISNRAFRLVHINSSCIKMALERFLATTELANRLDAMCDNPVFGNTSALSGVPVKPSATCPTPPNVPHSPQSTAKRKEETYSILWVGPTI